MWRQNVCSFYLEFDELIPHLFLFCNFSWQVWCWFLNWWWGCSFSVQGSVLDFFEQWKCLGCINFQTGFWTNLYTLLSPHFGWLEMKECLVMRSLHLILYASWFFIGCHYGWRLLKRDLPFSSFDLLVSTGIFFSLGT